MFTLRLARPTDNLPEVIRFYCDGLGLEELSSFADHNGFDGITSEAKVHRIILNLPISTVTKSERHQAKIIFWCFTYQIQKSGTVQSTGCKSTVTRRLNPTIPGGTMAGKHLRIRMAIGSCCSTPSGRNEGYSGNSVEG